MKRCIVLALLLLVSGSASAEEAPGEGAEDFRLIETSGDVAVIPAGETEAREAVAGLPLAEGDRVVTGRGGAAELAAKSGTVIRLDENSSLGLENLRSGWTTFRLSVGRFLGKFQKSLKSRYSVKTPVAVASVRGTEFVLDEA